MLIVYRIPVTRPCPILYTICTPILCGGITWAYPHKTRGWVSGFLHSSASDRRDNASEPRNNHPLVLIANMNCQRCKRRKIRCDKARPKCGTCTRLDAVCEYGTLVLQYSNSTRHWTSETRLQG